MQNNDQEILIWRSEYNINNFKIDSEHQKLFAIAREAINVTKLKDDIEINTKLKEIITKLFDYVNYHFKNEEIHENIVNTINEFVKELATLSEDSFEKELAKLIDGTIVHHIVQEDKKIISWLKANSSQNDS